MKDTGVINGGSFLDQYIQSCEYSIKTLDPPY